MSYEAKLARGKRWNAKRVIEDGKVVKDELQDKFDEETPKVALPLILKGVYLYYLSHTGGGQEKMEPKYKGDNEFPVQVLVTDKIRKQLMKWHKKLSYKEYDAKDFKKQFKVDPPFEAEEYVVIKLAGNATYRKDDKVEKLDPPRVMNVQKESLADTLVGNGSLGNVGFELFTYKHPKFGYGCSVNLKMINIIDLVKYVGKEDSLDDDEMGFEEGDFDDMDSVDDMEDNSEDSNEDLAAKELKEQAEAQQKTAEKNTDDEDDDGIF